SDSQLVENLLAVVSQHQRQKNGEQVIHRMRARVMNGYYPFRPPLGFRMETKRGCGKVMVPHEPMASVIRECFEGYVAGRYETQAEILRYLESLPYFPRDGRGLIRFERIRQMIENPLYAGMVHAPKWNIKARPGNHEGLVSVSTFKRANEKLNGKPIIVNRKNISEDFILRGYVTCSECGTKLTSCWAKGRTKKYPYYHCHNKLCSSFGKSIKRAELEKEVEDTIRALVPKASVIGAARAMFDVLWKRKQDRRHIHAETLRRSITAADKKIEGLLERIVETDSSRLIKTYEDKINELEQEKIVISERLQSAVKPKTTYTESVRTALEFLLNPIKPYTSGTSAQRRTVLKLAFGSPLSYSRDTGLRTAQPSMPFQLLQGLTADLERG
ncbi:MAG: recombinase family protein, partial [Pseudomonadota bacterium]